MIGRDQMAPVIALGRMPIGGSGRLLALAGHRRIPAKGRHTGEGPLIALGIVAELHGPSSFAIEPDGVG